MNRFGRQAMSMWQELVPQEVAEITDPETFFAQLGKEAEDAWVSLSLQLAGGDRPGETFLEKVGRLNAARMSAEEIIRSDWLRPPSSMSAESETTEEDEDGDKEGGDPFGLIELFHQREAEMEAAFELDRQQEAEEYRRRTQSEPPL